MPIQDAIVKYNKPLTKDMIKQGLSELGVVKGDSLIVHCSLKSIGYVVGSQVALIEAILEQVSEEGTVVMPAHSGDNSNPDDWQNPPVPREWCQILKDEIPAFDPKTTPTFHIGLVPETFRTYPGVVRSNHPQVSFCAWGRLKQEVTKNHEFNFSLGEHSPLGQLYRKGAKILMIGTDYETCTALHLSEYMANVRKNIVQECAAFVDGKREWIQYEDIDLDTEDFNEIGNHYEEKHTVKKVDIGAAECKLIDLSSLIDFATVFLKNN